MGKNLGRWPFRSSMRGYFLTRPFSADLLVAYVSGKAGNVHVHFSSTFFWNMQGGFFSQAWGVASAHRLFFSFLARLFNSSASAKLKKIVYVSPLWHTVQILISDDTAHSAGDVYVLAASRGGEFMTRLETAAHINGSLRS